MKLIFICIATIFFLIGCSTVPPSSIIPVSSSARPKAIAQNNPSNGAIFQADSFQPVFEDKRARFVGDTLTILVSEKSTADKTNVATGAILGNFNASVGQLFGAPAKSANKLGLITNTASTSSNTNTGVAGFDFSTTMGVTVIEVLANGNLLVSGEKQVGFDRGTEYIRFSGVVAVSNIGAGNIVSSSQVADARIEYRTNSQIDKSQVSSMMNRFFYSVLPL